MTLQTESQHFRGVVCLHCQAPIPVPAIVGRHESAGHEAWHENCCVFNLRCPSCHKEKPYQTREIVEFEGTPDVITPQARPTYMRSFQNSGIAKAAKA